MITAKRQDSRDLEGDEDLDTAFLPSMNYYSEFYLSATERQTAFIARYLSPQQGVVWGTGTHTTTPVLVTALGPGEEKFRGFKHATDIGKILLSLIAESKN